jgi:hypothetical protein
VKKLFLESLNDFFSFLEIFLSSPLRLFFQKN